ncbi:glycerophosphodiester phosphodiesterase [Jeotgalibaca sp. A127]|uniref:glycerophosphodiester phosphodiesterase n=1 Tax=Jeotgalibaca sp. A127 TaxID=3457324 RepID=UPI003FD2ECB6
MRTHILGHRGSKGTAPENTLISFKQALETGCDGIELDVHLSKDKVPVVIHDEFVDRTTNGKGLVQSFTVEELKKLDAGSWFKKKFADEQIPTLEEVLLFLKHEHFDGILNIELKTDQIDYQDIERIVLNMVETIQPAYKIIYSSFNYDTLERLLAINPRAEFGILFGKQGLETKSLSNGIPVQSWHGRFTLVNRMIRSNTDNLPLRLWTVNSLFDLGYCLSKNVDMIITDYPGRAMKVRKQIQGE